MLTAAETWTAAHPWTTQAIGAGVSGVGSYLSQKSAAEDQEKAILRSRRASNIAGVDYGGRGDPLKFPAIRRAQRQDLQTSTIQPGGT